MFISWFLKMKQHQKILAFLQGGLGNQCFVYAAARALSLRVGAELSFDGSYFWEDKIYGRKLALVPFNCSLGIVRYSCKFIRLIRRARYFFLRDSRFQFANYFYDPRPFRFRDPPEKWNETLILDGYFQSEKYFYDKKDIILQDFGLRNDSWLQKDDFADKILHCAEPVFLHVRSYKEVPGKHRGECALCMKQYYVNALAYMKSKFYKTTVFVFSDDIAWVRKSFLPDWELQYPCFEFYLMEEPSDQLRDFSLMRMCKHGIVADSSFSWWAGWLGEQEWLKKGECPIRVHIDRRVMNDDFWPERWIAIKG